MGNLIINIDRGNSSYHEVMPICYRTSGFTDILLDGVSIGLVREYEFTHSGTYRFQFVLEDPTTIPDIAFYNLDTPITSVIIPNGVTTIGERAFAYAHSLKDVVLPDSLTTINEGAFLACTIEQIELPDSLTTLASNTFAHCDNIKSIVIPDKIKTIQYDCFSQCSGLTEVTIPSGVTNILSNAFKLCTSLKTIICKAKTPPSIVRTSFVGVKIGGTLYIPKGSDYSSWMKDDSTYLGYYGWKVRESVMNTIEENLDRLIQAKAAIKAVIENKGVEVGDITLDGYAEKIASIEGGGGGTPSSGWTGHADADGLRAIGWTDEDIAYYQANGVNWNEEDDEYHLVSDDNKALYGVLTASNIQTYKDRIVYLPKIDTSSVTNMSSMFNVCSSLVSIPLLDTSSVTNMSYVFSNCASLISIPQLDTSNVTSMYHMFNGCHSLISIPQLDTSKVTNMQNMFNVCSSLVSIPLLDTSSVTNMSYMFSSCASLISIPQLDTSKVTNMQNMFNYCYSLVSIPQLDTSSVTKMDSMFNGCYSLTYANLKNQKIAVSLNYATLLSKESLLYIINNEASTSAFTITLKAYAYDRWATDADVVAALANHPNVTLASALE